MTASLPESHADLLDNANVAILSTVGADGYPQVTAIWYVRDGDRILTSLTTDRQKYKNADRHPKVTLFLLDPANPYRTLEIRGDFTSEPDLSLATLRRVVERYGTSLDTFPGPTTNRVTVTLTPQHVVAHG